MPPRRPAGSSAVDALLDGLAHPELGAIRALRKRILALDPAIREEVKWNAPSFAFEEHFATFRLHPPRGIQLVLHHGAKAVKPPKVVRLDDPQGRLRWVAADRCVLTFADGAALTVAGDEVERLLRGWIAQLPR